MRKGNNTIDSELEVRISRLRSTLDQATRDAQNRPEGEVVDVVNSLKVLGSWLDEALKPETPKQRRVQLVLMTEAELCIYTPKATLVADRIRLEDRFYRLSETAKKQWQLELAKFSDSKQPDEFAYRQLLRRLTYDLAEAAESFDRLSTERATALFRTLTCGLVIIVLLLGGFYFELESTSTQLLHQTDGNAFLRTLPNSVVLVLLLAGSMGAMITTIRSLIVDEKARTELVHILIVNMFIRVIFGALYAIVFVFALVAHILPVSPNTEIGLLQFFVVAGVAAGFSDQLFGQAISSFITSKGEKKSTKDRKP